MSKKALGETNDLPNGYIGKGRMTKNPRYRSLRDGSGLPKSAMDTTSPSNIWTRMQFLPIFRYFAAWYV
ncbi:hypothetical protein LQZ19_09355 [Treponema primitia]|uniref:hypothetical protein n=1 Tax=Treponema primitia TaxID=88058 RepID=UPI00397EB727